MDAWLGCLMEWMDGWTIKKGRVIDWKDGWIMNDKERLDEWMDGWIINEWQEESGPSTLKGQLNILYRIL